MRLLARKTATFQAVSQRFSGPCSDQNGISSSVSATAGTAVAEAAGAARGATAEAAAPATAAAAVTAAEAAAGTTARAAEIAASTAGCRHHGCRSSAARPGTDPVRPQWCICRCLPDPATCGLELAFDVDLPPALEVAFGHVGEALVENHHAVPLGLFALLAVAWSRQRSEVAIES